MVGIMRDLVASDVKATECPELAAMLRERDSPQRKFEPSPAGQAAQKRSPSGGSGKQLLPLPGGKNRGKGKGVQGNGKQPPARLGGKGKGKSAANTASASSSPRPSAELRTGAGGGSGGENSVNPERRSHMLPRPRGATVARSSTSGSGSVPAKQVAHAKPSNANSLELLEEAVVSRDREKAAMEAVAAVAAPPKKPLGAYEKWSHRKEVRSLLRQPPSLLPPPLPLPTH